MGLRGVCLRRNGPEATRSFPSEPPPPTRSPSLQTRGPRRRGGSDTQPGRCYLHRRILPVAKHLSLPAASQIFSKFDGLSVQCSFHFTSQSEIFHEISRTFFAKRSSQKFHSQLQISREISQFHTACFFEEKRPKSKMHKKQEKKLTRLTKSKNNIHN